VNAQPMKLWMVLLVAVVALAAALLFAAPAQAGTVNPPLDDVLTDTGRCGTVCQDAPSSFSCSGACIRRRPDGGVFGVIDLSTSGAANPNACLLALRAACRDMSQ
jgi:hypothetical protein